GIGPCLPKVGVATCISTLLVCVLIGTTTLACFPNSHLHSRPRHGCLADLPRLNKPRLKCLLVWSIYPTSALWHVSTIRTYHQFLPVPLAQQLPQYCLRSRQAHL
ncbi:hypothetical protein COCVIDRAFT_110948, partial [Bipolaris victoriae FI3]